MSAASRVLTGLGAGAVILSHLAGCPCRWIAPGGDARAKIAR